MTAVDVAAEVVDLGDPPLAPEVPRERPGRELDGALLGIAVGRRRVA